MASRQQSFSVYDQLREFNIAVRYLRKKVRLQSPLFVPWTFDRITFYFFFLGSNPEGKGIIRLSRINDLSFYFPQS